MTAITLASINQISTFLKVPVNKIAINNDKMPTCMINKKSVTGFVNIIFNLLNESKSHLSGDDCEEQAEIRQWLEYCVTYGFQYIGAQCVFQMLQDLNSVLATKTYFVGNALSIADVAMFYVLQNAMEKLSYLEKEKYLNVSRWYDNIQQNNDIRNNKPLIDFSTIFLSCVKIR